eukprot:UC1_evm3s664
MFARTLLALVALAAVASAAHHSWTGDMQGKVYNNQTTCDGTASVDINITSAKEVEGEAGCICWLLGGNSGGFEYSFYQKICIAKCANNTVTYNIENQCTDDTCGTCVGRPIVQTQPAPNNYETSDIYKCAAGTQNETDFAFIYDESTSTNADAFLEIMKHSIEKSGVAGCAASASSAAGASAAFFAVLAALAVMF